MAKLKVLLILLTVLELLASLSVDTKISTVTVYKSGAMIERTATTNCLKNRNEVRFSGLPSELKEPSLMINCSDNKNIEIIDFYMESVVKKAEKNKELNAKIDKLNEEQLNFQRKINLLKEKREFKENQQQSFLKGFENSEELLDFKKISVVKSEYFDFMRENNKQISELETSLVRLGTEIKELIAKKNETEKEKDTYLKDLVVIFESKKEMNADFSISYYMDNCSWNSQYNAYFFSDTNKAVIEYMATVTQKTAENWNDVKINISQDTPFIREVKTEKKITKDVYTSGTTGTIKGMVLDESGDPLPGANIIVTPLKGQFKTAAYGAETDEDGYFFILGIKEGTYNVTAQFIGYSPKEVKDVKVRAALATVQNFKMSAETIELEALSVEVKGGKGKELRFTDPKVRVEDVLKGTAGIKSDSSGELYFRGGRSGNGYVIDGVSVGDPTGSKSEPVEINFSNVDPSKPNYRSKNYEMKKAASDFISSEIKYDEHSSSYILPGSYSVLSAGEIKVNILKDNFLSRSSCLALPNLSNKLYSSEYFINETGMIFYPGQFNIFMDDSYIGQTEFGTIVPGDSVQVSFGEIRHIKMKRKVTEKRSSESNLLSKNMNTTELTIETDFTNIGDRDRTVFLQDPIPYTIGDSQEVEVNIMNEKDWNTETKGLISSKFILKKGESRKLKLVYRIKYPEDYKKIVFWD
jgi:hypothetical protein